MFRNFSSTAVRTAVGTVGMALCAGLCLFGATAPAAAHTPPRHSVVIADPGRSTLTVSAAASPVAPIA